MKKKIYRQLKKIFTKKHHGILDLDFYTTWYSDVKSLSTEQASEHWRRFGHNEGRHPNFDSFLASQKLTIGSLPIDFDWAFYCNHYLDLKQAGINNRFRAVVHYLKYGQKEGRICSPYNDFQKKHLGDFPEANQQAIDTIVDEINNNPRETGLDEFLGDKMKAFWQAKEAELTDLAKLHATQGPSVRASLLNETSTAVDFIADSFKKAFLALSEPLKTRINARRVLIVGDFFLPQCIRYRIEQKLEQLNQSGYEATAVSWTLPGKIFKELAFHDIVIFYRTPALPDIVRAIVYARALGKLTFYEIDDLLFEPIYPPPIESYGLDVTEERYLGLLKGMALYHNAAKLCEFGIASTQPLVERLGKLVESGTCFLHRNGLDSQNGDWSGNKSDKAFVDIFYGSGTQAHNSDFIEIALPALIFIMEKYHDVRLVVVGYLDLPGEFVDKFSQQLVRFPLLKHLPSYWNLLLNADINIAVLERNEINDCKSELKWFEAACFKIPSVVSKTANYEQVIVQGVDGIMVGTTEEWVSALESLIIDPTKREEIGSNAYRQVHARYSLEKLSANIDGIIQSAVKAKINTQNDARP